MNIEILADHIADFQNQIIDSGFKRDVQDYIDSLPNIQDNIVALRDISGNLRTALLDLYQSDLPDALQSIFPSSKVRSFMETHHLDDLKSLIEDKEIQQSDFFDRLMQFLQKLQNQLELNEIEIERINDFITPYIREETDKITKKHEAIISIIFKDQKTITNLKQFTKTIIAWNRVLPLYHQILKSESPADIEIIEIQNGSIDLVINIDFDVALNLADLFKIGFQAFAAYLAYKKMLLPITKTFFGNRKLIASEKVREVELLKNIGLSINKKISEQHKKAGKTSKPSMTNYKMSAKQVTNLVTSHIVNGNDIKILALPETETNEDNDKSKRELRQSSIEARNAVRLIPESDVRKLLEAYGKIQEITD